MSDNWNHLDEPPVEPEDTRPTGTYPRVELTEEIPEGELLPPDWGRIIGLLSLIGAIGFTIATIVVLLIPRNGDPVIVAQNTPLPMATNTPTPSPTTNVSQDTLDAPMLPTLDPMTAESLLQAPLVAIDTRQEVSIYRDMYEPFTIIPNRPRNEIILYEVVQGDTVSAIAERFGLEPETIAWSNPRRIVQVLRPGDTLNILPVDGVYFTAVGSTRTIADYAEQYQVDDPYIIIDSPFNTLVGYTPGEVPPSGTRIFIPGGQAEEVDWTITITGGDAGDTQGGASSASPATVSFQPGSPGHCGPQTAVGGSFWTNPLPPGSYTITQGFSSVHNGIDLAGAVGTTVRAANAGRVVFAGLDNFGYGYMIAIVHGPYWLTVYGHLSEVNVRCGEDVVSGQPIGKMGNSGNSSGPHLHFEIRTRQGSTFVPGDPAYTIGF